MKVAVYPGTFHPWHAGHQSILDQALKVFDKVVIAIGRNPYKDPLNFFAERMTSLRSTLQSPQIEVMMFSGLFSDYVAKCGDFTAVIKGLRNGTDLAYEQTQQYWNEDLGVTIPTFYIITDRSLVHISSSAIRAVEQFK